MFSLLVNKSFLDRMGTVENTVGSSFGEKDPLFEDANIDRVDFWISSIYIFKDHPLGIGVNNFANLVPEYDPRNPGMDPHNSYVLCYTEIGIIGIILFLFIIIESFLELRRAGTFIIQQQGGYNFHITSLSLGTIYITYCTGYMMTHSVLYTEIIWIYFALSTCLETAIKTMNLSGK